MSEKYYIYSLTCPIDLEVKYIGYCQDIKRRFSSHLSEARKGKYPKDKWITSIIEQGKKPILNVIIETNCRRDAKRFERMNIKKYRKTIFNTKNGYIASVLDFGSYAEMKRFCSLT